MLISTFFLCLNLITAAKASDAPLPDYCNNDNIEIDFNINKRFKRSNSDLIVNKIEVFIYDAKTNQYLITQRLVDGDNVWFIFGGVQQYGECYFECATRCGMQELGITIDPVKLLYNYSTFTYHPDGSTKRHYNHIVIFGLYSGGEFMMPEHLGGYKWIPMEVNRNIYFPEMYYPIFSCIYDQALNYIIENGLEENDLCIDLE